MNKRRRYIAKRKRNIRRWTRELNPAGNKNLAVRIRLVGQLRAIGGLVYAPDWF